MTNDVLAIGSSIAAALIALATFLPKLLSGYKRDKLDGAVADTQSSQVAGIQNAYEKQLSSLNGRFAKMELRVSAMETTIHMQAVKVTRLIIVVIHMKGLLSTHAVPVPTHIQTEIDLLTAPDLVEPQFDYDEDHHQHPHYPYNTK